jgi:hypothetical protein
MSYPNLRNNLGSHPLVTNYIVDATDNAATNAKWTSTTVQTYTVPTGKRWFLWGGAVTRDASTGTATLVVNLTDGTNTLMNLATEADATGETSLTADVPSNFTFPIIMDPGWTVVITVGEAQGAGAKATCVVTEVTIH